MEQLTGLKLETDSLEIPRLPDVDRERASWMCDRELMSRPQLHTEFASDLLSVHHIVSVRTTKKRRKCFESWHFESSYKSGGKQWKDYVFFVSKTSVHGSCLICQTIQTKQSNYQKHWVITESQLSLVAVFSED